MSESQSVRFSVVFSRLTKAIYTTHVLIVGSKQQGENGLKLQSTFMLDSHNLGLHIREDIAKILVLI